MGVKASDALIYPLGVPKLDRPVLNFLSILYVVGIRPVSSPCYWWANAVVLWKMCQWVWPVSFDVIAVPFRVGPPMEKKGVVSWQLPVGMPHFLDQFRTFDSRRWGSRRLALVILLPKPGLGHLFEIVRNFNRMRAGLTWKRKGKWVILVKNVSQFCAYQASQNFKFSNHSSGKKQS